MADESNGNCGRIKSGLFLGESMSRVPWHLFEKRQPRAHLVGGVVEVAADGDELAAALNLLKRLVRPQKPGGDYAATVARDAGCPQIYFGFEHEADAQRLAASVGAGPAVRCLGWASQRSFELDGAKLANLEASLPAPRNNPRQKEADRSPLLRRVRRVSRAYARRSDSEE